MKFQKLLNISQRLKKTFQKLLNISQRLKNTFQDQNHNWKKLKKGDLNTIPIDYENYFLIPK